MIRAGVFGAVLLSAHLAMADLKTAVDAYEFGDYSRAIKEFEVLLYPKNTLAEEDEVTARRLLGASYVVQGNNSKAKAEFAMLLQLRAEESLDPFKFSPEVRRLFEEVRSEIEEGKSKILENARSERLGKALQSGSKLLLDAEEKTPKFYGLVFQEKNVALSYVPIVGQVVNGDTKKALWFGLGELALLGTAVGSFLYLETFTEPLADNSVRCLIQDPDPTSGLTGPEYCIYARRLNQGSLLLSGLLLGLSVLDSRRNFVQEPPQLEELPPELGRRLLRRVRLSGTSLSFSW